MLSEELAERLIGVLERLVTAYERRLAFEERRDVRIAATAEIRDEIALKKLRREPPSER